MLLCLLSYLLPVFRANSKKYCQPLETHFQVFSAMLFCKHTFLLIENGEIKNIPLAFSEMEKIVKEMGEEFKAVLAEEQAKFKALEEEYKKTNKENNKYKQALGIFFLYANNINPYIKNELCRLLQGEIPFKESLEETAKEIEEIVKKIIETDAKAATPNLDAISEAQNENS